MGCDREKGGKGEKEGGGREGEGRGGRRRGEGERERERRREGGRGTQRERLTKVCILITWVNLLSISRLCTHSLVGIENPSVV